MVSSQQIRFIPPGAAPVRDEALGTLAHLLAENTPAALAFIAGNAAVCRRRNSNDLLRGFSASWIVAAATAAALTLSVLQLSNVAPFLYFNF